ncbi:MAG: hypothetical protein V4638_06555 [Bacteroidota bacterium]
MKKSILIADSGGTSTDWCFVAENGERNYFSGNSYHPIHWGESFMQTEQAFWSEKSNFLADEVYFFGAGCFAEEKAVRMKEMLEQLGHQNVHVKSDLHGAGLALFAEKSGVFAILGTGSVAAYFDDGEVVELKGGLGYILGDEGSAFSFGRLLLKLLLENRLSTELTQEIHIAIGDRSEIISKVYSENGRNFVANLALQFGASESKEIQWIHELNITTFLNSIESLKNLKKGIAFTGSYAFHQRHLIKEILIGKQVPIINVIQKPIEQITDYFLKSAK